MKEPERQFNLPMPIRAYFSADRLDGEALSHCFAEGAVVKDEGRTHIGRAAIKQWKDDVSKKYRYTCEPFACEQADGKTIVSCHLVGDFPGSPVDLRFFFALVDNKIASLEVIL